VPFGALFLDPGAGKTCCMLYIWRNKSQHHGHVLRMLVLCPTGVIGTWGREIAKFTKLDPRYVGLCLGRTAKQRLKVIHDPNVRILVMGYEALRNEDVFDAVMKFNPEIGVCDESHRVKARKSAIAQQARGIFSMIPYRFLMTGSAMPNHPEDIFYQFLLMDRGETFGIYVTAFRNRFFLMKEFKAKSGKRFFKYDFNPSMEAEFQEKLSRHSVRKKLEDCEDLPEFIDTIIEVPLSKEQGEHHKRLKNKLITWLDTQPDNPVVVKNALTKMLRLNEISSGYMRLEDGSLYRFKDNPRQDALIEKINDLKPHKVIIFCVFKENYEQIREALDRGKIGFTEIHGGIIGKQKDINEERFKKDPNIQCCIINPKSGGEGLNLQIAQYSIFYTRNFVDITQPKARNRRLGSIKLHKKIVHYHFIAPDTIDEYMYNAVQCKMAVAENLLDLKKILTDA